ncbi:leukocyte cell-derived chemotaxin 2-like [Scleropages formosus]|uniref:Leukocyte cell-derived chemotaxin 2-like n=1 Tax=Scleropages formosus TaxID=113540 RepID=A0A0P7XYR3_SCLFO|nr:leukocyte cell-derived chemotaxin 2-like [Scleropages formosus]
MKKGEKLGTMLPMQKVYTGITSHVHVQMCDKSDPTKAGGTRKHMGLDIVCTDGLCFKLFYVKPVKTSGTMKKGEKLGTMLPMQKVYTGITSHVHVQMCDKSDPTKYF